MMTIMEILNSLGIPAAYGRFQTEQTPPYVVYLGGGQAQFLADDTYYKRREEYSVEYYFRKKNAEAETELENAFLQAGWRYDKSEDVYLEDERIFVIYYTTWQG